MRLVLLVFGLVIGVGTVFAQKNGIGLRFGNPFGITYKKYLPNDRALEFGFGTAGAGWSENYYRNSFDDYNRYDDYDFQSYSVKSTVYFQGRYQFHYDIPIEGMVGKLQWYWGLGAMLKFASVKYTYQNKEPPFNVANDNRTDIDFGPEGMAGMEYTFEDIPLTLFGDLSLMLEFADRPLTLRAFAGVGARFNF